MINTYEEIIGSAKKYNNVVFLCGDSFSEKEEFSRFFRDKVFSLGFGARNLFSSAAGFVVRGKMPIIFVDVSDVIAAYKQINDGICAANLNVKIVGIGGEDMRDIEIMKLLPNMRVVSDVSEIISGYGPCYLRIISH